MRSSLHPLPSSSSSMHKRNPAGRDPSSSSSPSASSSSPSASSSSPSPSPSSSSTSSSSKPKPSAAEDAEVNSWSLSEKVFLAIIVLIVLGWIFFLFPVILSGELWSSWNKMRHLKPFKGPLLVNSVNEISSKDHKQEYFWGTYRPQVYFGVRARASPSLIAGLMWTPTEGPANLRHTCEQGDHLRKYGWIEHNGVDFGKQEIVDSDVNLVTEFVKVPGGDHGGNWAARVSGKVNTTATGKVDAKMNLFFYLGFEGYTPVKFTNDGGKISLSGNSRGFGSYSLDFTKIDTANFEVSTIGTKNNHFHNLTDLVKGNLKNRSPPRTPMKYMLPNVIEDHAKLVVVQLQISLPFTVDIAFHSHSSPESQHEHLKGEKLSTLLKEKSASFHERFAQNFGLASKGYSAEHTAFAKVAFSNLLGGIGYWHGESLVRDPDGPSARNYWDASLYTAVPSRSFFPRGFLWDEGFHQLLVGSWDLRISKDVLSHWLDLMNQDGWIPREQILGEEARSKVPREFVVQHTTYANPPTLLFPIRRILEHFKKTGSSDDAQFLKAAFPRLQTWFNWYNTTQAGPLPNSYRWRGRDNQTERELNPKTLTSGLDDFPRASHPSTSERHVDLLCWMAEASRIMTEIAEIIGEPSELYAGTWKRLSSMDNLNALHWDEKNLAYADFGLHTSGVSLEWTTEQKERAPPVNLLKRVVAKGKKPTEKYVNQFGYVNLFPFLMKLVDADSIQLGKILSDIENPQVLWTNFGLRSLSASSSLYMKHNTEHDAPYWRGPIWINLNYLTLSALHHYKGIHGPHQEHTARVYVALRDNVVNNIYSEFKRTGFLWEQYDPASGQGKGCHPFSGWTALVVLIMAETY